MPDQPDETPFFKLYNKKINEKLSYHDPCSCHVSVIPNAVDDEWEEGGEDDEAESKETKPAVPFITFYLGEIWSRVRHMFRLWTKNI